MSGPQSRSGNGVEEKIHPEQGFEHKFSHHAVHSTVTILTEPRQLSINIEDKTSGRNM
jgi:hypothetical protein